ncbi:MAG: hypothetical protein JXR96_07150 [Deltaproteobacteria bacterium]|nr:hypothetical protein [Deltaproteobacteria bacterium]
MRERSGESKPPLPASLRRRSDLDAVREDISPYLGTTVEERSEILSRLCRLAAEQIDARPDGQRILDFQQRRSASSLALWLRLVASSRAAG